MSCHMNEIEMNIMAKEDQICSRITPRQCRIILSKTRPIISMYFILCSKLHILCRASNAAKKDYIGSITPWQYKIVLSKTLLLRLLGTRAPFAMFHY